MEYRFAQLPGEMTSACVMVIVPVQLSVAMTEASSKDGTADEQLTVVLEGTEVLTGAVWSSTVIVWVEVLELPHTSVAVQVRVTVKRFAQLPAVITSATPTVTTPAQLSVADTEPVEATGTSDAQLTVVFDGVPVITGAVWSLTVIVWVAVEKLPHTSVAV